MHPKQAEGSAENRYHVCITFQNLKLLSGTVRCESIVNGTVGAEIFIQNGNESNGEFHPVLDFMKGNLFLCFQTKGTHPRLGRCSKKDSIPLLVGNNSKNIVPCKIKGGTDKRESLQIQLVENPQLAAENSSSVAQMPAAAMLSSSANYDPRIGFRLNKPIVRNTTYECKNLQNSQDCLQFLAAFTEADQKIHAKIRYIKGNQDHSISDEVQCSVEKPNMKLNLKIMPCSTLPSCARRNFAVS